MCAFPLHTPKPNSYAFRNLYNVCYLELHRLVNGSPVGGYLTPLIIRNNAPASYYSLQIVKTQRYAPHPVYLRHK
jgi:hypothetical protein